MKVQFPEDLEQFTHSSGRNFRKSHHIDGVVELSQYEITSPGEFISVGFVLVSAPQEPLESKPAQAQQPIDQQAQEI